MSYSPKQAIDERNIDVWHALKEDDAEKLYHLAAQFKEEGDDENAASLLAIARKIEKDEWAYDEAKDNELQDNLY